MSNKPKIKLVTKDTIKQPPQIQTPIETLQPESKKPLLNLIVCLPGPDFSNTFLVNWSEFLMSCFNNNINVMVSQEFSSVVYYVRNKCLGGDVLRGTKQKPFDGKINYDYMLWIDNDVVFNFKKFQQLLSHEKDVVAGYYKMHGGKYFAVVQDWDEEHFKKNGAFHFWTEEDVEKLDGKLTEVAYVGLGFMLIKRGVVEKLDYPWFRPNWYNLGEGVEDFSSEDTSFCRNLIKEGVKIWVDPKCRVGHEKKVIL